MSGSSATMREGSSNLGMGLRFTSWSTALIAIVVIKAILTLALKPGSFLVSYSGISYFLLLLLATNFAILNGMQDTLGGRPFWVLLAIGYGLWLLHQAFLCTTNVVCTSKCPTIRLRIRYCFCISYRSSQLWQPFRTATDLTASYTGRL